MAIVNVYKFPYYGNSIACPNERNSIPSTSWASKFDMCEPFFCDHDGVLIDNDKKSICRIIIDADIKHSLQRAIDYISKCKVRGEKGKLDKS